MNVLVTPTLMSLDELKTFVLQAKKDYDRANEIYLKLLAQNPDDPDLRLKLAQTGLATVGGTA